MIISSYYSIEGEAERHTGQVNPLSLQKQSIASRPWVWAQKVLISSSRLLCAACVAARGRLPEGIKIGQGVVLCQGQQGSPGDPHQVYSRGPLHRSEISNTPWLRNFLKHSSSEACWKKHKTFPGGERKGFKGITGYPEFRGLQLYMYAISLLLKLIPQTFIKYLRFIRP